MENSWQSMKLEAERCALAAGSFTLRPLQEEVLYQLAHGNHVFAGMATGYGKSACYWLPAQAWQWRVWVISPLISLMEDQVLACAKLGLRALAPRRETRRRLEEGDWDICFLSPERLRAWAHGGYLQKLRALGLEPDLLVLDEMHCLEEWRSFRPAYGEIFERVKHWVSRDTIFLGLSASLARKDSHAWMSELCGQYAHIAGGLGRENLHLRVVPLEEESLRWLLLVTELSEIAAPESALVYCGTRRETDEVARWLRSAGLSAVAYHAGLPEKERAARSQAFRAGHLRVVCATSAFGMGIDYPHVSRVIHFSLPHDLESYWQEVGRAGRGGQDARAVAFWRRSEISRVRGMKHGSEARERFVALWKAWMSGICRKRAVAQRLGLAEEDCGTCDRCLKINPEESSVSIRGEINLREPWWLKREAMPEEWLERKTSAEPGRDATKRNCSGKILDGV